MERVVVLRRRPLERQQQRRRSQLVGRAEWNWGGG